MFIQAFLLTIGLAAQLLLGCWATSSSEATLDDELPARPQQEDVTFSGFIGNSPGWVLPTFVHEAEPARQVVTSSAKHSRSGDPSSGFVGSPKRIKRVSAAVGDTPAFTAPFPSRSGTRIPRQFQGNGIASMQGSQAAYEAERTNQLFRGVQHLHAPGFTHHSTFGPFQQNAQGVLPSLFRDAQGGTGSSSQRMPLSSTSSGVSPPARWTLASSISRSGERLSSLRISDSSESASGDRPSGRWDFPPPFFSGAYPLKPWEPPNPLKSMPLSSVKHGLPELPKDMEPERKFATWWKHYLELHSGPQPVIFDRDQFSASYDSEMMLRKYISRIQALNMLKE